jgi:TrbL/VirB6 plasmid conjugal transfer protein
VAGKTGSATAAELKNFSWMTNMVLANIVLIIVYQLFSLDIIEMTMSSVQEITSSTAGSLVYNFGLFALALASLGIVVRAYIQENWKAFFKLITLILISLTLLFSIQTKKFNYIDLAHGISTTLENALMNVNPSLSDDVSFQFVHLDDHSKKSISISIENKVFDALIYKPYLLLQYGTTDEAKINEEKPDRIQDYLEADPTTKDGMDKLKEIAKTEYEDYGNKNIYDGNAFKQTGYIMVMMLSTIIQGIVFFFIALVRIMLQFAFIVMMLLAPFMIFISLFPSIEALVGKYLRGTFLLILFKGITMFFILVATSFITLGYDKTNMSDDLYYRIFIQIIFSTAIIFMYMKRQFIFHMLEGASPTLSDMGAERTGRTTLSRGKMGLQKANQVGKTTIGGLKTGKQMAFTGIQKAGVGFAVASETARNAKGKIGERIQKAREYIGQVQRGHIPNDENPYQSAENEIAASEEDVSPVSVHGENVAVLPSKKTGRSSLRNPGSSHIHHVHKENFDSMKLDNPKTPKEATSSLSSKHSKNNSHSYDNQISKYVSESTQTTNLENKNSARNPYQYKYENRQKEK